MLTLKIDYPCHVTIIPVLNINITDRGLDVALQGQEIMDHVPRSSYVTAFIMNEAGKTIEITHGDEVKVQMEQASLPPNIGEIDNPNN